MDNFIQQDIFFFITTAAVIFIALLLGALLIYLISILRTVDYILRKVRSETDIIAEELTDLRNNIRREGIKIKHFTKFFTKVRKGTHGKEK
jgi:membrane protein DedA with SNARE-associated domain